MWWLVLAACTAREPAFDEAVHVSSVPLQSTEQGLYVIFWRSLRSPLPYGVGSDVWVRVTSAEEPPTPVDGASVEWTSIAPDGTTVWEQDGLPTGDGEYLVEQVVVDQPGWWTFEITVDGEWGTDHARFHAACCSGGDTG